MFPFWLLYLKKIWYSEITMDKKKRGKYAAFYSDLHLSKGPEVLVWPFYFLIRRLLMAVIVVLFRNHLIWQIMLMTINVIIAVIILGENNPFETFFKRDI